MEELAGIGKSRQVNNILQHTEIGSAGHVLGKVLYYRQNKIA